MRIALPIPPSVNHYWKPRRGGGIYVCSEGKAYRHIALSAANFRRIQPVEPFVGVDIVFVPSDRRLRDIDNIQKCLLDSLQFAGFYENDSKVIDLRIRKTVPDKPLSGVHVEVSRIESEYTLDLLG